MGQGVYQTNTITTQSVASQQSNSTLETKQATVTKVYGTSSYVKSADVRIVGASADTVNVPNVTGSLLTQGSKVTINFLAGNPARPQITGFSGGNSSAIAASANAAQQAATASTVSGNTNNTATNAPVWLSSSDTTDAPNGYVVEPGANVTIAEVSSEFTSGGVTTSGTATITAKPLCGTSLPSGQFLDGTLFDLVDSYKNGLGIYRYDLAKESWILRTPVTTVNGESGAVTLVQGANVTITQAGDIITIASTGGGGGSLTVTDGTHTETGITEIVFSGAVVSSGGSGIADVSITGGSTYTGTAPITVTGTVISIGNATTSSVGVVQLETSSTDTSSSHVVTANDTRLINVSSLNSLTGGITLAAGTGVSLSIIGSTITINSTGSSSNKAAMLLWEQDVTDAPNGLVLTPGANVTIVDTPGSNSSGGSLNGLETITVKPLTGIVLPSGQFLDGTLFDLINSYGVGVGIYRYSSSLNSWVLRTPATSNSLARKPLTVTSGIIAYGASDTTKVLPCNKTANLMWCSTNVPALIRFYSTQAAQIADAGRAIGLKNPNPSNAGVLAELGTTASNLGPLTGPFILQNLDNPANEYIYLTIYNLSLVTQSVTLTAEVLPLEY